MDTPGIVPDTKDWTVVITDGCAECAFDPAYDVTTTGARLRASVPRWRTALRHATVAERPTPGVWSPLEYACHVRDVCRLFRDRLELMLRDDDARFENWDQDRTAVADRYGEQDPAVVSVELEDAAAALARLLDSVEGEQWERTGVRSNGSRFTVRTFAVYLLHDVEHHLHDVGA